MGENGREDWIGMVGSGLAGCPCMLLCVCFGLGWVGLGWVVVYHYHRQIIIVISIGVCCFQLVVVWCVDNLCCLLYLPFEYLVSY